MYVSLVLLPSFELVGQVEDATSDMFAALQLVVGRALVVKQ